MEAVQLLINGLANGCIYGLIALGFVLIYKATEMVNFAQGDFMMLGAFICLGLTNTDQFGLPFFVAIPLAMLIMGVFGYLLDVTVFRAIFGQQQFAIVILTIALGFILRFIAGFIWGHDPLTLETPMVGQQASVGGLIIGADEIAVIGVTFALTIGLYFFFSRTKLGVAMQASSQNQLAAYYMGIPVKRVQSLIWALSGVVSAVAGILFASKGSIDPTIGFLGIKAFAAAVIGGFGSLPGALIGGMIIGVTEQFGQRYVNPEVSRIAPYAIMLIVLVVRPNGLFAQIQRKKV